MVASGSPPFQPPTRCRRPSTRPKRSSSVAAQLARGPLVEQVDDPGVDPVGVEAEVGDERVEDRLVAVGERQRGAGLGEPGGDDRAEPAAGAGDRDHAPVE